MQRPENHVTAAQRERIGGGPQSIPFPDLTPAQKLWLEVNYPAKCMGVNESVEQHLRYAGMVTLAQTLISAYKSGEEDGTELDPELLGEKINQ